MYSPPSLPWRRRLIPTMSAQSGKASGMSSMRPSLRAFPISLPSSLGVTRGRKKVGGRGGHTAVVGGGAMMINHPRGPFPSEVCTYVAVLQRSSQSHQMGIHSVPADPAGRVTSVIYTCFISFCPPPTADRSKNALTCVQKRDRTIIHQAHRGMLQYFIRAVNPIRWASILSRADPAVRNRARAHMAIPLTVPLTVPFTVPLLRYVSTLTQSTHRSRPGRSKQNKSAFFFICVRVSAGECGLTARNPNATHHKTTRRMNYYCCRNFPLSCKTTGVAIYFCKIACITIALPKKK